jgi:8-oxo-dGTP diphosphatase
MRNYVVGLMFDSSKKNVLLLKKTHPPWQAGKYNGPGGASEENEIPRNAMIREFKEETGIENNNWSLRITLFVRGINNVDMEIRVYAAVGDISNAKAMTDEIPKVFPVNDLPDNLIPNLRWIIPMCLDSQLDFPIVMTIRPPT